MVFYGMYAEHIPILYMDMYTFVYMCLCAGVFTFIYIAVR